ncbi:uncharacterized protein LOC101238206 isoform X3 [Hydra vulgaris]|uniref:Uncharacterized protein LOC101238206 isoform X3 n=1 Tax=Hydra vulgaris TaxID=6087 RepID=A0ABM4CZL7_HYDVU
MVICRVLIIFQLLFIPPCSPGTWVNMTITYDFVASNEIIILQNAIEENGKIDTMRVGLYNMTSIDVPPPPFDFTAVAISLDSINASWTPVNVTIDGNLTVQGYTVFYRKYQDPNSQWNWTSCQNTTYLVIDRLDPYTTYILRVLAFHSMGNGISSYAVVERTFEGTPPEEPKNLTCTSDSSSSVTLYWSRVMEWRGFKRSYTAIYKLFTVNESFSYVTFSTNDVTGKISNLKVFSKYELYLTADTNAGSGPQAWCVFTTLGTVPSVGPLIIGWYLDQYRPSEAVIRWNPIPDNYTNGKLLYYKISYGISRSGKVFFPPKMTDVWVDQYTTGYVIKNLSVNAEYTVYIAGETIMGAGNRSDTIFIESCKCPTNIYTAWYKDDKDRSLIYGNDQNITGGIMYDFLKDMTASICSSCPGLISGAVSYNLYWDRTKDGHSPQRSSHDDLKKLVDNNVHFSLPINGKASVVTFQSKFKYVQIVSSPGVAFIVRDASADFNKSKAVATAIFYCWPAVIIIFLFSTISGTFMWILDRKINKIEFPNESFIRGILHGTYWAFISMTTIGYGDKTPRSTPAKIAAIFWLLTGPITNAIVIGAITTSLTSVKLSSDPILYGSKIGAIYNTCEYALGVRRNAKMDTTGYLFKNIESLLNALESKVLDGILLDSLKVVSVIESFQKRNFKIVKIIPEQCGWGVVLSSDIIKVEEEIRSYVNAQAQMMKKLVDNITKSIQVGKKVYTLDTGLIDPKSKISQGIYYYGSIVILCAIILGFTFEISCARLKKQKLQPYSANEVLEVKLSKFVRKFCNHLRINIEMQIQKDDAEISAFFQQKGYSLGLGWLRYLTEDEEILKKQMKYQEIMSIDLNQSKSDFNVWSKLKDGARVLHRKEYNIF